MASYDYLKARVKYLEEALDELRHTYPQIVDEILDRAMKKARGYAGGKAYPRDRRREPGEHPNPMHHRIFNILIDAGVRGDIAGNVADHICRLFDTPAKGLAPVTLEITDAVEGLERLGAGDAGFVYRLLRESLGYALAGSITDLNAVSVRRLPDQELLSLHRRTHQLWGLKDAEHVEEISKEDIANAHALLKKEMVRRGMRHNRRDSLDDVSKELEGVEDLIRSRPRRILVPEYISIVGSSVEAFDEAEDIDILVRASRRDRSVELQVRKAIDPDKRKDLHFIYQPTGPHGDYLPLYHLALVPTDDLSVRHIEATGRLQVTLIGTGAMNSPRKGNSCLIRYQDMRVLLDADTDVQPRDLPAKLDAILVTDPQAHPEHIKKLAEATGAEVQSEFSRGGLRIERRRVTHTSHDTYGFLIRAGGKKVAFAPEFFKVPSWIDDVDLAVVEGSAWDRPITFTGRVGGHAAILDTTEELKGRARRVVFTHIGKPVEEALKQGAELPEGFEIGRDGQTIVLEHRLIEAVRPGGRYVLMKPSMTGITDAYSVAELEPWFEKHSKRADIYASPKIDGLRAVVSHNGKTDVWFEDARESKVPAAMPELHGSFVIEGEYTAKRGGQWLSRVELAGSIKDPNVTPIFHLYDLLYVDGKDVSDLPFSERLKLLRKLKLPKPNFTVLPQRKVKSVAGLRDAVRWAFAFSPISEGLFLREDGPYDFGPTSTAAKLKAGLELKVKVLSVIRRSNGYVYRSGLREPGSYRNVTGDGKYVDLGNTFVSKEKIARQGDTLNVLVEELGESEGKLYWGKPHPQSVDRSRPAYTVRQAISMAKRRGVWKERAKEAYEGVIVYLRVPDDVSRKIEAELIPPIGKPTDFPHLTLAYLGDVGELEPSDRDRLTAVLDEFSEAAPPVVGFLSGVARLSLVDNRNVICLLVDSPQLPTWRQELVDRVGNLVRQKHGFVPHITLVEVGKDDRVELTLRDPIPAVFEFIGLAWDGRRTEFMLRGNPGRISEGTDDVGDTKSEYWEEHWHEMLPRSGGGKFTLQAHWRGLTEDETRLDYADLTKTSNSLHFDIRHTAQGGDLWGLTIFAGRASQNRVPRVFKGGGVMRGTFKYSQPSAWLRVARRGPWVREPGETGATAEAFAKFFELDHGTYKLGVCRMHSLEIFYKGAKLEGRYLMTYAPVSKEELARLREAGLSDTLAQEAEERGRIWLFRPSPGEPIAKKYDKKRLIAELKRKGQRYLYWNDPTDQARPELIDVQKASD